RGCESAQGQGGVLDPCPGELLRVVAQPILPPLQQPRRAGRAAVRQRRGGRGGVALEDGVDDRLGVGARPPDELERRAVAVARDTLGRNALLAPRPEVAETGGRREREALLEVGLVAC